MGTDCRAVPLEQWLSAIRIEQRAFPLAAGDSTGEQGTVAQARIENHRFLEGEWNRPALDGASEIESTPGRNATAVPGKGGTDSGAVDPCCVFVVVMLQRTLRAGVLHDEYGFPRLRGASTDTNIKAQRDYADSTSSLTFPVSSYPTRCVPTHWRRRTVKEHETRLPEKVQTSARRRNGDDLAVIFGTRSFRAISLGQLSARPEV